MMAAEFEFASADAEHTARRQDSSVCQIDDRSGAASTKYMMLFGVSQS
jgi:hypothetical protein